MTETVLVLGATSGIARALCQVMAGRGCRLILAGRRPDALERIAADLRIRYGATTVVEPFDAREFDAHSRFFERCTSRLEGGLDGVVVCYGALVDQPNAQVDFAEARRGIDVNFTSVVSLLGLAANYLEGRKAGYIAAISSVAGDLGRRRNYVYGAAKAGLSTYLQGLRSRLHHAGVAVITIKPGFVDTVMTQGRVRPPAPLIAAPERVARDIDRAIRRRRSSIYTPWFWGVIMRVLRLLPEAITMRLNF